MLNVERWTPLECTQCQPFLHKIRNMSIPTGTSSNATTSKCLHPYRPNLNSPSSLFHAVTVIRFYCLLLCLESRLVPEPGGILRFQSLCRNLAKSHRDFIPNYFWNMSHPILSIERYYCYLHFANQVSLKAHSNSDIYKFLMPAWNYRQRALARGLVLGFFPVYSTWTIWVHAVVSHDVMHTWSFSQCKLCRVAPKFPDSSA